MSVVITENVLLKLFKNEPFHNLYQYYQLPIPYKRILYERILYDKAYNGGSCSVKTLSAQRCLQNHQGIIAKLHSSYVHFNKKKNRHSLLRIIIAGKHYFADVGNGWPAIKLFPAHQPTQFTSYGIKFFSKLFPDHLKIYQIRNKETQHNVTIPLNYIPESFVLREIEKYSHKNIAPNGELRFAQIINDKFIFLRDKQIHIYCKTGKEVINRYSYSHEKILATVFHFNLQDFLKKYSAR